MELALIDNGEVIDTIDDIEDFQLRKPFARAVLAEGVEAMIQLALNKRETQIDGLK